MSNNNIIVFDAEKQSMLTDVATDICDSILWKDGGRMPRIPLLSQTGQEDAFYKVSDMATAMIVGDARLSYDEDARSGVLFWSFALISANSKKFRVAMAAAKRKAPRFYEAGAFLQWYGTEMHPSLAVAANVMLWRKMREDGSFSSSHWTKKGLKEGGA